MKKFARLLLCLLLIGSLTLPVYASPAQTVTVSSQSRSHNRAPNNNKKTTKILMIGNSYTWYNDLHLILERICASAGVKADVTAVTRGGASLLLYANKSSSMGRRVHQLLKNQKWDYVILQDRHFYPIAHPERLYDAVLSLKPYIEAAGAKTVLFMTWAPYRYHKDYQRYENIVKNREDYQAQIQEIYETTAKEANAIVVPAGLSILNVDNAKTGVRTLRQDGSHPSYAGSYITACTIFKTLFPNAAGTITYYGKFQSRPKVARTLQKIAADTVRNYRQPQVSAKAAETFPSGYPDYSVVKEQILKTEDIIEHGLRFFNPALHTIFSSLYSTLKELPVNALSPDYIN